MKKPKFCKACGLRLIKKPAGVFNEETGKEKVCYTCPEKGECLREYSNNMEKAAEEIREYNANKSWWQSEKASPYMMPSPAFEIAMALDDEHTEIVLDE